MYARFAGYTKKEIAKLSTSLPGSDLIIFVSITLLFCFVCQSTQGLGMADSHCISQRFSTLCCMTATMASHGASVESYSSDRGF